MHTHGKSGTLSRMILHISCRLGKRNKSQELSLKSSWILCKAPSMTYLLPRPTARDRAVSRSELSAPHLSKHTGAVSLVWQCRLSCGAVTTFNFCFLVCVCVVIVATAEDAVIPDWQQSRNMIKQVESRTYSKPSNLIDIERGHNWLSAHRKQRIIFWPLVWLTVTASLLRVRHGEMVVPFHANVAMASHAWSNDDAWFGAGSARSESKEDPGKKETKMSPWRFVSAIPGWDVWRRHVSHSFHSNQSSRDTGWAPAARWPGRSGVGANLLVMYPLQAPGHCSCEPLLKCKSSAAESLQSLGQLVDQFLTGDVEFGGFAVMLWPVLIEMAYPFMKGMCLKEMLMSLVDSWVCSLRVRSFWITSFFFSCLLLCCFIWMICFATMHVLSCPFYSSKFRRRKEL